MSKLTHLFVGFVITASILAFSILFKEPGYYFYVSLIFHFSHFVLFCSLTDERKFCVAGKERLLFHLDLRIHFSLTIFRGRCLEFSSQNQTKMAYRLTNLSYFFRNLNYSYSQKNFIVATFLFNCFSVYINIYFKL